MVNVEAFSKRHVFLASPPLAHAGDVLALCFHTHVASLSPQPSSLDRRSF